MGRGKIQKETDILEKLAVLLETKVKNRRVIIPEKFGRGYLARFIFNEHIRMLIVDYELNKELIVQTQQIRPQAETIVFKFQNIASKTGIPLGDEQLNKTPSVLITTKGMNTDVILPSHINTAAIHIAVEANYLNRLFGLSEKSAVLQSLSHNSQQLLFEEMTYPSLQRIVDEIMNKSVDEKFELVYFKIKAEELICRLLMELEKREEQHLYALNIHDIQAIYKVKDQMLKVLDTPPNINELAASAGMSVSKLQRLFKQIFGGSIFSYYQDVRMKEAARLLKEEMLSVSEVGYQMGFTNLSHFSRVFDKHIGMKPKQYTRS